MRILESTSLLVNQSRVVSSKCSVEKGERRGKEGIHLSRLLIVRKRKDLEIFGTFSFSFLNSPSKSMTFKPLPSLISLSKSLMKVSVSISEPSFPLKVREEVGKELIEGKD